MKRCPKCGRQYPADANFCPIDAGRLVADEGDDASAAPTGETLGVGATVGDRFELGEHIAGGRTGAVHLATDRTTGAACVVKLADPSVFPTALLLQRTERELKQLERLTCPSLASVLGHGKVGAQLWIATELVAGASTLEQTVVQHGPLGADRAAAVALAVGAALGDAARAGVIHRDLAPKNVLFAEDGSIKVINFGVPVPGRVQGVPEFVAPEQVEGKPVDQRSSIYSMGALLYFALTGAPPYTGDAEEVHRQHLQATPQPPSAAGCDPALDELVLKSLENTSSKRYMTLRQLLGEIERVARGADPGSTQPFGRAGQGDGAGKGKSRRGPVAETMLGGFSAIRAEVAAPASGEAAAPALDGGGASGSAVATRRMDSVEEQSLAQAQPRAASPSVEAPVPAQPTRPEPVLAPLPGADPEPEPARVAPLEPAVVVAPVAAAAAPEAAPPSGKRRRRSSRASSKQPASQGKSKAKFRETMWFKKGELDAAAAEAAAVSPKATGDMPAIDRADGLPNEDRYDDDGSLTAGDQERFSLKTGSTEMMQAYRDRPGGGESVDEEDLVREMRGSRTWIIAALVLGLAAIGGIIAFAATRG